MGHAERKHAKAELIDLVKALWREGCQDSEAIAKLVGRSPQRIRQLVAQLGLRSRPVAVDEWAQRLPAGLLADLSDFRKR